MQDPYLEASALNIATYDDFLNRLIRIATSLFEWENLPESMNGFVLENNLIYNGQAAVLYDRKFGLINTKCSYGSSVNIYGRPLKLQCYSYHYQAFRTTFTGLVDNNYKLMASQKYGVLVENNKERLPTIPSLRLYAQRLTRAMRTEDINIAQQRTPYFIPTNNTNEYTVKTAYKTIDENTPVIFGDKTQLGLEGWSAVKTDAPYVADKIQIYRQKIWNEALTFLGIQSYREKRERQVVDEVNASNEEVNLNLQASLAPRQYAARQINECFGLKDDKAIRVKVRSDLENLIKQNESIVSQLYSNPGGDNE